MPARRWVTNIATLVALTLLAGALAAAYSGIRTLDESIHAEREVLRVIGRFENLRAALLQADSLRREYLATGDPARTARLATVRERIRQSLAELGRREYESGPNVELVRIRHAVNEALAAIEQSLNERRTLPPEQAQRLAFSSQWAQAMDRAERLVGEALERERMAARHREDRAAEDLRFLERGMAVGIALAAALLLWAGIAARQRDAARRTAEELLQARSRELRLLIDAMPAMISCVDPEERFVFHNRAYAEWLGVPSARIDGRPLREVIGEGGYLEAKPYLARALAGEEVRYERQQPDAGGQFRDLAVSYVPQRGVAGSVAGVYALLTDITELKRLERMRGDFMSMASHELRTPITAIRGAIGMLAGGAAGALPKEAAELVAMANTGCERLTRLVDQVLDIERMEAGQLPVTLREEDLARVVPLALVAAMPVAAQRRIRIEPYWAATPPKVRTDSDRVTQVLTNLLSNAIQFSPPGGVVRIVVEPLGERVRISVRDQGPGVSDEMRARLFERFAQDPGAARGSTGRFGLGLAISKMLVENLGGRIGYEPAPGGGASFWFELPAAGAPA